METITIGLDLAKHWFQVHGVDAAGKIVVKRRLGRAEVVQFFRGQEACLVGMEACATAHHWARELLALGHEVKLMPPAWVKAYVKRNKNDAADAAAICEAVRPAAPIAARQSFGRDSLPATTMKPTERGHRLGFSKEIATHLEQGCCFLDGDVKADKERNADREPGQHLPIPKLPRAPLSASAATRSSRSSARSRASSSSLIQCFSWTGLMKKLHTRPQNSRRP